MGMSVCREVCVFRAPFKASPSLPVGTERCQQEGAATSSVPLTAEMLALHEGLLGAKYLANALDGPSNR